MATVNYLSGKGGADVAVQLEKSSTPKVVFLSALVPAELLTRLPMSRLSNMSRKVRERVTT